VLAVTDPPRAYAAADVVDKLRSLPRRPWEVGGWLLGYWTADRTAVMVTHATPPGPRGTPWGVRISAAGHRPRFDEAWEASGGLVTFLGDWHTHPGGPARPSDRDRRAAQLLATDLDFRTPTPVIAIVAQPRLISRAGYVEIGWYVHDDTLDSLDVSVSRSLPDAARSVPKWPWPHRRRTPARASAQAPPTMGADTP
jgi:integrative and conjugative element protein (TIGR02256 family)